MKSFTKPNNSKSPALKPVMVDENTHKLLVTKKAKFELANPGLQITFSRIIYDWAVNDLGIPESALTNHTHGNGKAQHDLQKNLKEGRH